ncbi:MAG: hypothetical protein M0Z48_00465 [Nitrospiraceae bacterium]|nr:hypothetical protein [Nitrospiraceae bacterium]
MRGVKGSGKKAKRAYVRKAKEETADTPESAMPRASNKVTLAGLKCILDGDELEIYLRGLVRQEVRRALRELGGANA